MLTKIADPKELWESLCDVSANSSPFPNLEAVLQYLESVVVKEGVSNCFDMPPFDTMSIWELAEMLWQFQVDSTQK